MSGPSLRAWKRGLLPAGAVGIVSFALIGVCIGYPCASTGLRYGVWLEQCPATDLRLDIAVNAFGLIRGELGVVEVHPTALWMEGEGAGAWVDRAAMVRGAKVQLALLDPEGQPVDLPIEGTEHDAGAIRTKVRLPVVPDGDYELRVTVTTPFETRTVQLDLPLYAPAVAHLLTDRPLYKPGQEVLLRSVLLERTDLEPLDGRPGEWRIFAPDGTEMHVEKARAGAFGIAETSFPLDRFAEVGTWRAAWQSGDARDEVGFEVRPFRLPRFTVELAPDARWYNIGEQVGVEGVARYTSGAPVANAPVQLRVFHASGRWPAPLAWEEPFAARTKADGTFTVDLGEVPPDLIERATFTVQALVIEEAGEVASGGSQLVLSKDDLMVEAVTELGDGLVGGFNNRAYVRVMTPDGRPIPSAEVTITNPWDAAWKPRDGQADADAVVALQLDPGKPVTVVDPAAPVRIRPMVPDAPNLSSANELASGRGLELAERRALDRVYDDIAACGDFTIGNRVVSLGVRVDRAGTVRDVLHDDDAASRCAAAATRKVRFPAGPERTWQLGWTLPDSLRPSITPDVRTAWGDSNGVPDAFARAALDARRCMPRSSGIDGTKVFDLHWRTTERSTTVATALDEQTGTGLAPATLACLRSAMSRVQLADAATSGGLGVATIRLSVPRPPNSHQPGPTARTAYELKVAARTDGAAIGETRLVLPVGEIPPLRMRATPSIAHAGDTVTVELFRGPSFQGVLPEKLWLQHGSKRLVEGELADKAVTYQIPDDAEGFLHVEYAGARVVVLVQPRDPLTLAIATDQPAYRPGETAKLTVTTTLGDQPVDAGVGLVGVDSALGQLATLLAPDDWGRVTVRATSDRPAFGSFDPRALTLGQVRGGNAAQAAVLRISQIPTDSGGDVPIGANGHGTPDLDEALTAGFYSAFERLVPKVRKWEATAPEGELMRPDRMVTLWNEGLTDLRADGEPAVDAFGRELTLDVLPHDLLEQVDPRQVVADGTRLPEDVISWTRFVAEEVGR